MDRVIILMLMAVSGHRLTVLLLMTVRVVVSGQTMEVGGQIRCPVVDGSPWKYICLVVDGSPWTY